MIYNPYQMAYPQPPFQVPSNPQQNNTASVGNIIWVSGEAGAKSYLVAPNTTVQLWDSERQTIYLKSADASGMPSIKTLDYTIREDKAPNLPLQGMENTQGIEYATKDDLKALKGEIIDLVKEEMKA